jgi:hypothetical protein
VKHFWGLGILFGLVALLQIAIITGLVRPAPPQEPQIDRQWSFVVMSDGPSFRTACYRGDRLYVMDSYFHRANTWHLTSPKTLAVAKGACQ